MLRNAYRAQRSLAWVALAIVAGLGASAAQAGTVSWKDGQGSWTSSECVAPKVPVFPSAHDPEAAANDLNAQIAQHNRFAAEAQDYMACLSREAKRDADGSAALVAKAAQAEIYQMQAQVASSAARMEPSSVVVVPPPAAAR